MRVSVLLLGLVLAATASAQKRRTSWQDICFNNPSAPFCQGKDYAIKKPKGTAKKDGSPGDAGDADSSASTPEEEPTPSVIVVGGIDWRFADPLADALAGFNFSGLTNSAVARGLVAQLGATQGLTDAEVQNIFTRLCGVDRVALSVHGSKLVAMVTGVSGATPPAMEEGWKAVPVSQNAMLIGHAEAVDQAAQRVAAKTPPAEWTRAAEQWQSNTEYWAVGSGGFAGPQAVTAGLQRFSLAISLRNMVASDLEFEFGGAPGADALRLWPMPGDINGNSFHAKISITPNAAPQWFGEIAGSPLGQRLASLLKVARYLPVRETAPRQSKPVINGLGGGPK